MMGLAPGTVFSPYLAAKNNSDKPLTVRPIFSYSSGNRIDNAALPAISLGGQESVLVKWETVSGQWSDSSISGRRQYRFAV